MNLNGVNRPFGTVIVLNGASSAGKTSLLNAVQATLAEPFLEAGLDKFLWMLPSRYRRAPLWDDVLGQATRGGAVGDRLVRSMHCAIAALARSGSHVVADHVFVEPAWLLHCTEVLQGLPTLFVGVICPLSTLEERERTRTDRTLGQASLQYELVHRGARYDLVIDTSKLAPEEGATLIARHLSEVGPNSAFNSGPRSAA